MIPTLSVEKYLSLCEKAITMSSTHKDAFEVSEDLVKSIINIQSIVNESFFFTKHFSTLCYKENELQQAVANGSDFLESVRVWIDFVREVHTMASAKKTILEASFYSLMSYFSISDEACLKNDMVTNFLSQDQDSQKEIIEFYKNNDFLWQSFNPYEENYNLVTERVSVLKKHENDFIWLFNRLEDFRSKSILLKILRRWLDFSAKELLNMSDSCFDEYRDFDLINSLKEGAIVDCGAYNGDTAICFAEAYNCKNNIYCFEASPANFEALKNNTAMIDNVICLQKAVGDDYKKMTIGNEDLSGSIIKGGDIEVDVVPIDGEIKEPIALVKMDIEGAEQSAINGMKNHILTEKPDLIICSYHGNHDIIEIPMLIDTIRPDYKLYLRYSGTMAVPIDFAIYAV